ncbi:MAG: hypothetical protein AAF627_22080 [Myxococcota bacterium]
MSTRGSRDLRHEHALACLLAVSCGRCVDDTDDDVQAPPKLAEVGETRELEFPAASPTDSIALVEVQYCPTRDAFCLGQLSESGSSARCVDATTGQLILDERSEANSVEILCDSELAVIAFVDRQPNSSPTGVRLREDVRRAGDRTWIVEAERRCPRFRSEVDSVTAIANEDPSRSPELYLGEDACLPACGGGISWTKLDRNDGETTCISMGGRTDFEHTGFHPFSHVMVGFSRDTFENVIAPVGPEFREAENLPRGDIFWGLGESVVVVSQTEGALLSRDCQLSNGCGEPSGLKLGKVDAVTKTGASGSLGFVGLSSQSGKRAVMTEGLVFELPDRTLGLGGRLIPEGQLIALLRYQCGDEGTDACLRLEVLAPGN